VKVITINVGHNDTEQRAKSFIRRTSMKQLAVFDQKSAITQQYRVFGVPTIIVAKKGGDIIFRQHFVPSEGEIKALLQ